MDIKDSIYVRIVTLLIIGVLFRWIPHPPNFSPILSILLYSSIHDKDNRYLSFVLPLSILVVSDFVLGFYSIQLWVYLSYTVISVLNLNTTSLSPSKVLMSSLVFFLISNFGVFYLSSIHTFENLLLTYLLSIPFFVNSIIGDFFFSYTLDYYHKWGVSKFIFSK